MENRDVSESEEVVQILESLIRKTAELEKRLKELMESTEETPR